MPLGYLFAKAFSAEADMLSGHRLPLEKRAVFPQYLAASHRCADT